MHYGEKVREIRKHFGDTQGEFAERINMSRSNVSMIETGERGVSLDLVKMLARELRVDPRFFVDETDSMFFDRTEKPSEEHMWNVIEEVNRKLHPGETEKEMAHLLKINKPLGELIELLQGEDANLINEIKNIADGFIRGAKWKRNQSKRETESNEEAI